MICRNAFIVFATIGLFITAGCQSAKERQASAITQPTAESHNATRTVVKMYGGVPHVVKQQIHIAEQ